MSEQTRDRPDYRLIAKHLMRAVILAFIGVYVARLSAAGSLSLYIAPRMAVYTKLAAAGLYLIAAALFYQALRAWHGQDAAACGEDCGHDHHHGPTGSWRRQVAAYGLFALPLALFFLTPDTTIGSAMAARKGISLTGTATISQQQLVRTEAAKTAADGRTAATGETTAGATATSEAATGTSAATDAPPAAGDAPGAAADAGDSETQEPAATSELDRLFPHDSLTRPYAEYALELYHQSTIEIKDKNYLEKLSTLAFFPDQFVGHRVTISGFVYRDDTVAQGQFVLGRFAIQCCAADALPYGIIVEAAGEKKYVDDEWLTITGTLSKTTYDGNDVMLLKADEAVKIKPAKDPYVYPDMDFGA